MPSLKDFIAALQAGWFPALAALIGCSIIVAGDWCHIPYLRDAPRWLITVAVVTGVFSFSILAANVAYAPVFLYKRWKIKKRRKNFRDYIEREIFALPDEEIAILAYLVTTGRKAFPASIDDRRLIPLVSKGLIIKLSGTNSILEWPYVVHDDVWKFLTDNKDRLAMPEAHQMPDPFHWRNR